jgi:hypothetical protein
LPKKVAEDKPDESVTFSLEQKKKQIEEISTDITIKKKSKRKSEPFVESETIKISEIPKTTEEIESESQITITKPEIKEDISEVVIERPKKKSIESVEELSIKLPKKVIEGKPDESVTFSIEEKQKQVEEISTDITIKKKPKRKSEPFVESETIKISEIPKTSEEIESESQITITKPETIEDISELTIDRPKKKSIESVEELSIKLPKKVAEDKPDESVTFSLEQKKKQIEEISTDITIKKKPKLKTKITELEESATIITSSIPSEISEEESAEITVTVPTLESDIEKTTEEIEEINLQLKSKKAKKFVEEEEEVFKIALKKSTQLKESENLIESEFTVKAMPEKKALQFSEVDKSFDLSLPKTKSTEKRVTQLEESATIQIPSLQESTYTVSEEEAALTIRKEDQIEVPAITIMKEIQVRTLDNHFIFIFN